MCLCPCHKIIAVLVPFRRAHISCGLNSASLFPCVDSTPTCAHPHSTHLSSSPALIRILPLLTCSHLLLSDLSFIPSSLPLRSCTPPSTCIAAPLSTHAAAFYYTHNRPLLLPPLRARRPSPRRPGWTLLPLSPPCQNQSRSWVTKRTLQPCRR